MEREGFEPRYIDANKEDKWMGDPCPTTPDACYSLKNIDIFDLPYYC